MGLFNTFNAGDLVHTSGVYVVLHSTPHLASCTGLTN